MRTTILAAAMVSAAGAAAMGQELQWTQRVSAFPADIDHSGQINSADTSLFGTCYLCSDPRADVTRNGIIDIADVVRFDQSFTCGCNPP